MKFAINKKHRDFFQKNGWIEFEDFLEDSKINQLNQAIDQVLINRLHSNIKNFHLLESEELFLKGHDLWRANEIIKKIACYRPLVEIASELIEKKTLRLAYDQLFPTPKKDPFLNLKNSQIYNNFLNQKYTLQDISCIQGIVCGVMIALNHIENFTIQENEIFSSQAGQVVFFQPQKLIDWQQVYEHKNQRFYLIVYAQTLAYYQLKPQDPHTHFLKQLGYIFNDKLSDKLNPIVFR